MERVDVMVTMTKKQIERLDVNNMKALAVVRALLFGITHGHVNDFDVTSTLEVVQDYLIDNNSFFDLN